MLSSKGFDVSSIFPVSADVRLRAIEGDCVLVNRRQPASALNRTQVTERLQALKQT